MADPKQTVSFNPKNNRLIYVIKQSDSPFSIKKEDNFSQVETKLITTYRIPPVGPCNTFTSTCKQNEIPMSSKILPIHFAIEDSIHQIKDSYPPHRNSSQECELKIPLVFLPRTRYTPPIITLSHYF